ncbi:MAG: endolytic transglycosylase MltG [Holosporales bacterium]|nr:endolytic transglycosylase MltG [Holosporales bacterium]
MQKIGHLLFVAFTAIPTPQKITNFLGQTLAIVYVLICNLLGPRRALMIRSFFRMFYPVGVTKYLLFLILLSPTFCAPNIDRTCNFCSSNVFSSAPIITIPPKSSVFSIADILVKGEIIKSKWLFILNALTTRAYSNLRAGQYRFPKGANHSDIIYALKKGLVIIHKVTIPEGATVYRAGEIIKSNPCLSGGIASLPKEGYLLPGTYYFSQGELRQNLVNRLNASMIQTLKTVNSKFLNSDEILILASIVEKETKLPQEKQTVAGVYLARLKLKMRLQADPTVIYAISGTVGTMSRALTRQDLKFASPYNTYMHCGLPPTAICCPGKDTLVAVANAKPEEYLYFVADHTGGHAFSETLEGHNANVKKWRLLKQADKSGAK